MTNNETTEPTNLDRALKGKAVLAAWIAENGDQGDTETNLSDMLADLTHYADLAGVDSFGHCERRGYRTWTEEVAEHGRVRADPAAAKIDGADYD